MGIPETGGGAEYSSYLLQKLSRRDVAEIEPGVTLAVDSIVEWLNSSFDKAMNMCNSKTKTRQCK